MAAWTLEGMQAQVRMSWAQLQPYYCNDGDGASHLRFSMAF